MTITETKQLIRNLKNESCTMRREKFSNSCAHYRVYEFSDKSQLLIHSTLAVSVFIADRIVHLPNR